MYPDLLDAENTYISRYLLVGLAAQFHVERSGAVLTVVAGRR